MLFNLPINLSINEEDLERKIMDELYTDICKDVEKKVEAAFNKRTDTRYYYDKNHDKESLNDWIQAKVNQILEENEAKIVEGAIEKLADKLVRTKAVKAAAVERVEKMGEGSDIYV